MDKAVSNIVVALIFSAVALYGFGAVSPKDLPYATVHYDGGHQVVGIILKQDSYSIIELSYNGNIVQASDIPEFIDFLDEYKTETGVDVFEYLGGNVVVKGEAGVLFEGTLNSFQLRTDEVYFSSNDQTLSSKMIKDALNKLERKIKDNHEAHARSALTYNKAPQEL